REELAHGRNRADPHHPRVDPGDGAADEGAERLRAERARLLLARDHERRRAVVDPARIPGRDRAALAEGGSESGERLRARVRSRVLVALDAVDGDELVREAAGLLRRRPALLRAEP